jgi:hypothetical protein
LARNLVEFIVARLLDRRLGNRRERCLFYDEKVADFMEGTQRKPMTYFIAVAMRSPCIAWLVELYDFRALSAPVGFRRDCDPRSKKSGRPSKTLCEER